MRESNFCERAIWRSDLVYLARKIEIHIGNTTTVMSSCFDLGISPAEFNVRVMICCLSDLADPVYERKAFGKVCKFKSPCQLFVLLRPPVEFFQLRIDL